MRNNTKTASPTPHILIHVALLHEAWPLIDKLGLKQKETQPYKIFRSKEIALVVSGVGTENTRQALYWILEKEPFTGALNVGTAACSDMSLPLGSAFSISSIENQADQSKLVLSKKIVPNLSRLPLFTVSQPLCAWEPGPVRLADMEASAFGGEASRYLSKDRIASVKIVSDYGWDKIPSKETTQSLVGANLHTWLEKTVTAMLSAGSPVDGSSIKTTTTRTTGDSVWEAIQSSSVFQSLDQTDKHALEQTTRFHRLSFSQLKQLVDMGIDFRMWDEIPLAHRLADFFSSGKELFNAIKQQWENLKITPNTYDNFKGRPAITTSQKQITSKPESNLGFGKCPVASPKTRCCNLLTLDAVEGCGFECSYCAVKTFYQPGEIVLNSAFAHNLKKLQLDPSKSYHIGTGQSSDSLLFGNRDGLLDALVDFANRYPKVILEFKSKSDNITHLQTLELPPNILFTWTLNTPTIINAEEHGTASLEGRLNAARQMAQKGSLVGFHFHPIVDYQNSEAEYTELYQRVRDRFKSDDVALISFGTLTFTKPVIKQLRHSPMRSRILQMPLIEASGKFSYPLATKEKMFRHAYESFKDWHNHVFFYLCMEDTALWPKVFPFDYPDNETFEAAMMEHYEQQVNERRALLLRRQH